MISRAEIIWRARNLWPLESVPYSQNTLSQNGYRQDCSGYVSMCWGLDPSAFGWGGGTTVTLVTSRAMREIPRADCQPGDAVGRCGPGTGGDFGHIVLFEKWLNNDPNDSRFWVLEQMGDAKGPISRYWNFDTLPAEWRAWRYTGLKGEAMGIEGQQAKDLADAGFVARSVSNAEGGGVVGLHVAAGEAWTHAKAADDQVRQDLRLDQETLTEVQRIIPTLGAKIDRLMLPVSDVEELAHAIAGLTVTALANRIAQIIKEVAEAERTD